MSFKINVFPKVIELLDIYRFLSDYFDRRMGSDQINSFVRDIGNWDMDTNGSIVIPVPGLNLKGIVGLKVVIFKDDLTLSDPSLVTAGISINEIDPIAKTITLTRESGGFYDSVDYDDSTINRGRITLEV